MERERIVSLQILRFIAAMMVVVFHTTYLVDQLPSASGRPIFHGLAGVGPAGVDIFFVLSGFVIALTGPLASPRPSGALFLWRRWRRVAPVYFVISLPEVVNAARAGGLSADRLAATFLFWPATGSGVVYPYLEPGWTLCFEMVFYLTVSLILVGGRLGRNLAIGAAAVAVLVVARLALEGAALRFLVNPIFLEFAVGVALAVASRRLARAPVPLGMFFLGLGVGALAVEAAIGVADVGLAVHVLTGQGAFTRVLLFGAPAAAIVGGALICERLCRGAVAAVLARFGDASYAIYLTHFAAINLVGMAWVALRAPASAPAIVGCSLAAALAIGLLCHRVIERPILRDLKRLRPIRLPWRPAAVASAEPGAPV